MSLVSRWCLLKNYFVRKNCWPKIFDNNKKKLRLYNSVDMIQSMNGIVCWYNLLFMENCMTTKIVIYWYSIIRVDWARMLLFSFGLLMYCRTELNWRASYNTWFTTWLWSGHVTVVKIPKCDVGKNNFWDLISINNISTAFFNWKSLTLFSLVLLIITNVLLLFNVIDWKIIFPYIWFWL